jgi:hypothetical protein
MLGILYTALRFEESPRDGFQSVALAVGAGLAMGYFTGCGSAAQAGRNDAIIQPEQEMTSFKAEFVVRECPQWTGCNPEDAFDVCYLQQPLTERNIITSQLEALKP